MGIILATLGSMGMRLMTGKIIEKLVIFAVGELVKRTSSKADDRLFEIVKKGLGKS